MPNVIDATLIAFSRSNFRVNRAGFYYDVASALADKVPLFSILKDYESRARRRSLGDSLMYKEMLKSLQYGTLSIALKPMVSNTELILLDAIQRGGDAGLVDGLMFLSEIVDKLDRMKTLIRKALFLPLMLLVLMSSMMTAFALYAVPIIEALLPHDLWPPSGKLLYATSDFIRHYGIYVAGAFFSLLSLFLFSLTRWQSPWRRRLDKFMPYEMFRVYSGSMLIVSLSVLLKSGVSLRSALERAMKFSDVWMRWHIREILANLSDRNAARFGSAFRTGLLNWDMEDRIEDAAKRQDPVAAFVKIGVGSIDKIFKSVENASSKINTMLLVLGGIVLGTMMLGFVFTTMEIQSNMDAKRGEIPQVMK